jgi:periplasmic protein TonB
MFESVVPADVTLRRSVLYSTLPLSLTLHLIAVAGLLFGAVWKVVFPTDLPRIGVAYRIGELRPPPPPPPPPPSPSTSAAAVESTSTPPMAPIVAPTVIPEEIPDALHLRNEEGVEGGVTGGVAAGVLEGGVIGGLVGGVVGGVIGGTGVADPPSDPVEFPRDSLLPMAIIWKPYPDYPLRAQQKRIEDELVVRYIVGKNGRVKSVTVIDPPSHEEFAKATITRLKEWRFRPFLDESGNPREVAHELLVKFRLVPRSK